MAISLAQTQTSSGSAAGAITTENIIWGSNTNTGNFICVSVGYYDGGTHTRVVSSITDSQSNTYTLAIQGTVSSNMRAEIWYAANITGGATPTVTMNYVSTGVRPTTVMREYTGIRTSSPLDVTAEGTPATATAWTTAASSATNTNSELVAVCAAVNGSSTATLGSGYSNLQNLTNANISSVRGAFEDAIISGTGAQTGTFTESPSASGNIVLATFKAVSASSVSGISTIQRISSMTL